MSNYSYSRTASLALGLMTPGEIERVNDRAARSSCDALLPRQLLGKFTRHMPFAVPEQPFSSDRALCIWLLLRLGEPGFLYALRRLESMNKPYTFWFDGNGVNLTLEES